MSDAERKKAEHLFNRAADIGDLIIAAENAKPKPDQKRIAELLAEAGTLDIDDDTLRAYSAELDRIQLARKGPRLGLAGLKAEALQRKAASADAS
jgi:hypothetical protein